MIRKKFEMWILEHTLNQMKEKGMTKEDVLRAVDKVYGAAAQPVVVPPLVAPPVTPPPTPVVAAEKVQPASLFAKPAPVVDFQKMSKARFGFAGQNKQNLFKSCVNGRLEDLPILNEAHCLKAWGMFKNWYRDYDCLGFQFEGFLARGLALKEEINCIEDLLDPKYDFSGVSNWSNLMIARGYTHEGWYANVAQGAGFMPKTFVILIVDAQSKNQPRFIMSGEDHPRLKDEDRWQEGECMIHLPTSKIDLSKSFKHVCNRTQKQTWFVKL